MTTGGISSEHGKNNQDYEKLLEILVCTICKSKLVMTKDPTNKFKCSNCKKEFKIQDGIVIMDE